MPATNYCNTVCDFEQSYDTSDECITSYYTLGYLFKNQQQLSSYGYSLNVENPAWMDSIGFNF